MRSRERESERESLSPGQSLAPALKRTEQKNWERQRWTSEEAESEQCCLFLSHFSRLFISFITWSYSRIPSVMAARVHIQADIDSPATIILLEFTPPPCSLTSDTQVHWQIMSRTRRCPSEQQEHQQEIVKIAQSVYYLFCNCKKQLVVFFVSECGHESCGWKG